jgi:hypothetical protein
MYGHLDCLIYAHEHGCEWDKDTCKYVAEQIMEILANDYKINIDPIGIKNPLWSELISLTHDINSGGKFYNIKSF